MGSIGSGNLKILLEVRLILHNYVYLLTRIHLFRYNDIYRVFNGNCGKETDDISGGNTHNFLIFLYLDYTVANSYSLIRIRLFYPFLLANYNLGHMERRQIDSTRFYSASSSYCFWKTAKNTIYKYLQIMIRIYTPKSNKFTRRGMHQIIGI